MQKKKQTHQILIVDGGMSFANDAKALEWLIKCDWDLVEKRHSWKKWLADGLVDHFDTIRIDMPNTMNAKYDEWKIWFEKYFKHIHGTHHHLTHRTTLERIEEKKHEEEHANDTKLILIGHSLGGAFLMKYLSESGFPRGIDALHLVAPVLDDDGVKDESIATFAFSTGGLPHLHKSIPHIHIWGSTDDSVVPYDQAIRYHVSMIGSVLHTFHNRGHFVDQAHFVELFEEILKTTK
jgi:predicted alpha/beta hydrolase family esterase